MPRQAEEEQVEECVQQLHIVANNEVRDALSELTKPTVSVYVNGRVIQAEGENILVVDQIATEVNNELPIVASEEAREILATVDASRGEVEVTIVGEVVEQPGKNVLLLDNVIRSKALPIVVDEKVQNRLSELTSSDEGGEVPVKAKVVSENGHKYLVIAE